MTTTVTATAPPPPRTPSAAPRRTRRRWPMLLLVAAVLLAGMTALRGDDRPQHTAAAPLDASVSGTYVLDDGRYLTLWGSAHSPHYELDGRVTSLTAMGSGRYTAMGGDETLTARRDRTGTVTHLDLEAGEGSQEAVPARLHLERDIGFSNADVHLEGSLLLPTGPGPHPAVVIVHGAERHADRDNYRLLGSHFARRGVAAFVYDKRGVGASTGSFAHATFDDLTADAIAGVDAISAQPDIDTERVGLLGFSQGGWVVAKAAAESDAVAFVAAYSPSGFSPGDQQAWLHGSMLTARGFERPGLIIADRVSRMLYSSLELIDAGIMPSIPEVPGFWFHALDLHTDSTALWEQVRQPTLLAWGALDCQVPAHDSMQALGDALQRGGNRDVTLTVLAEADHSFHLVEPCGHETGMAHHGSMHYADGYFDLGPEWVHAISTTERGDTKRAIAGRQETAVLDWHLDAPAPAPWYGTLLVQFGTLLLLLGTFGFITVRWLIAAVRRPGTEGSAAWSGRLIGAAGLVGLLATVTGLAAITEIAMLGDTRAAFLLGGPTTNGISPLMAAARTLVALTTGLTVAIGVGLGHPRRSARWVIAAANLILLAWAAYWSLLPLL